MKARLPPFPSFAPSAGSARPGPACRPLRPAPPVLSPSVLSLLAAALLALQGAPVAAQAAGIRGLQGSPGVAGSGPGSEIRRIGPGAQPGAGGSALGYGTEYQRQRLEMQRDRDKAAREGDLPGLARLDHAARQRELERQRRLRKRLEESQGAIGTPAAPDGLP